jgi:HAD superfamily hydrolase (TIGR01549 family)
MIKLLIFDAGDLLWTCSVKGLEKAMEKFFKKNKIDGDIINSRWNKIKSRVEVGKIKYDDAIKIQFKGLVTNKKIIREWMDIHYEEIAFTRNLRPYVRPTLKRLKKRYKLVMLTDDYKGKRYKLNICKRLGVDLFDDIFSSQDTGFKKPQKGAFFTVLKHFRVKPEEVVFIGHSKDEVEGARKYKIITIAYKWDKGTKSDFYVKRFSDIPEVLEKI